MDRGVSKQPNLTQPDQYGASTIDMLQQSLTQIGVSQLSTFKPDQTVSDQRQSNALSDTVYEDLQFVVQRHIDEFFDSIIQSESFSKLKTAFEPFHFEKDQPQASYFKPFTFQED